MGASGSPSVLYVGYKGDEVLGVKTAEEWAAERGWKLSDRERRMQALLSDGQ